MGTHTVVAAAGEWLRDCSRRYYGLGFGLQSVAEVLYNQNRTVMLALKQRGNTPLDGLRQAGLERSSIIRIARADERSRRLVNSANDVLADMLMLQLLLFRCTLHDYAVIN